MVLISTANNRLTMNRILKILPFLLLCAFALQVMPVGAQQQMFLQRTQQAAPPPSAGLLDPDYKGSVFAAAIDVLLYGSYTAIDDIPGSQTFGQSGQWSVAILRDFDDAIKSFTPSQVADGTANTWVQALGPSNGFIRRWYDQSVTTLNVSNLNHANQTTKANMPKLFDSVTGLILENGKAALQWDGTLGKRLDTNIFTSYAQPITRIAVAKVSSGYITDGDLRGVIGQAVTSGKYRLFSGVSLDQGTTTGNQEIWYGHFDGNTSQLYINGAGLGAGSAGTEGLNQVVIGAHVTNFPGTELDGTVQLVVAYPSDQLTNRTAISGLINTEYNNIY